MDYGIGVSTIILDYKIEKNKDVVAAILDLCAKGYLSLTQQGKNTVFKQTNKSIDDLLSNESYIYNLIVNKSKSKFDVNELKRLCYEDSLNLGLIERTGKYNSIKEISEKSLYIVPLIIALPLTIIYYCHKKYRGIDIVEKVISIVIGAPFAFTFIFIVLPLIIL